MQPTVLDKELARIDRELNKIYRKRDQICEQRAQLCDEYIKQHQLVPAQSFAKAVWKRNGKTRADEIVRTTVHDQLLNHDEMYNVGTILRKANELKTWLDRLFNVGIEVHKSVPDAASKEWQMAESLMHDGQTLAYRHALMCCIDPSDDIKVDSTLKALAKDPTVSERIIERLKV